MKDYINTTEARTFLLELMPQAGKILKDYFTSRNFTHTSKGGFDFMTQADAEADAFILKKLKAHFPRANFLTEESAPKDYSHLYEVENLWIVDPLDGTINFSRGTPHFAISIGLVHAGKPTLGVIYMPMTGEIYWAEKDDPIAYHYAEPIHVSKVDDLGESVIACDWAWGLEKRKNVVRWLGQISPNVRQIKSMGSAVADLAQLAAGRIDGYIHSGLKPWDVAAAALLVEKAGGKITTPEGKEWNVFQPDILATNTLLHAKILRLIKE
jgi:myo-inositol-1(or 4)-monophosphatase